MESAEKVIERLVDAISADPLVEGAANRLGTLLRDGSWGASAIEAALRDATGKLDDDEG